MDLLLEIMRAVQELYPFRLLAYAILPDHLHWLMRTPEEVTYSQVMQSIKHNFTLNYKSELDIARSLSLWQERFWDHVIRDADDLRHHFDYIQYNPVKHGLVDRPEDWTHSRFHFWLEQGYYDLGWGCARPEHIKDMNLE